MADMSSLWLSLEFRRPLLACGFLVDAMSRRALPSRSPRKARQDGSGICLVASWTLNPRLSSQTCLAPSSYFLPLTAP